MNPVRTRAGGRKANLTALAGPRGRAVTRAMEAAQTCLTRHTTPQLLALVGQTIPDVPKVQPIDKAVIQKSCCGGTLAETDDLLAGRGLFYITEQRKLFLDCTSGQYQMTWGYGHEVLTQAVLEGIRQGVVWDNHSNIPQWPVKRLAQKLIEVVNPDCPELQRGDFSAIMESKDRLNTVMLSVCTGSVACSSALKILLVHHSRTKPEAGRPVIVVLDGNYHGTDMIAQRLRGMWKEYFRNIEVVTVQPNDEDGIERVFRQHGRRIAGFWAEPIMMNREAILVERDYLHRVRRLCDAAEACMVLDEIQTGFWWPEVMMFPRYGIVPDIVVLGKGMTAGFHPLAGLVYKRKYDCLAQYDSINTNGNAALAALVGLACIDLIQRHRKEIGRVAQHYFDRLQEIPAAHPNRILRIHGNGLMAGLKFRDVKDALTFHRRCVERGLWVRAHAYHEGHSTVLTKLGLATDRRIADFVVDRLLEILGEKP